jgi:hydrogenase large subunit
MSQRVTIDPVTRIEGHLRVDVEVDAGKVRKAWASGQMWRGVENILIGRDPRDAWAITQRICGVCTTVHALASVRAVENALQLELPVNAQYIRNMIILAHAVHDHIVHFYHLSALDWVDVTSALKADPARPPAWPRASRAGRATARPNSPRSRSAWPASSAPGSSASSPTVTGDIRR